MNTANPQSCATYARFAGFNVHDHRNSLRQVDLFKASASKRLAVGIRFVRNIN